MLIIFLTMLVISSRYLAFFTLFCYVLSVITLRKVHLTRAKAMQIKPSVRVKASAREDPTYFPPPFFPRNRKFQGTNR